MTNPAKPDRTAQTVVADRPTERVGDQVKERRRELMAAEFERIAMDLFVARGYANVSVDDIAEAAGVSTRTFYRYFTAKEDVLALFPRRLTEFVRKALVEEQPGRPVFDVMASVLVKLAQSMDLDELRRWCGVVMSDRVSYSSMALNDLDLRQDMEPLLAQRSGATAVDAMLFDLALRAGQAAITSATATWYTQGGDFVALLQEALGVFSRGFANASKSTRQT
jgi:AcrR family transcriptional regulator